MTHSEAMEERLFIVDGPLSVSRTVEKDGRLSLSFLVLPGVSAGVDVSVDIVGEGAEVSLSGVCISSGEDRVDFRIRLSHSSGGSVSSQKFHCIAAGKSSVGFDGKIIVATDAQKTEAYQENHNILVGDFSKARTTPQLEIYADDVKCSHGATVGRLDEQARFYMLSRGIPEDEAKALQLMSFVAPALEQFPEARRDAVTEMVEKSIRSLL